MGNCLVIQDKMKEIKIIMRVDGSKVLEMPSSSSSSPLNKVQREAFVVDPLMTTGGLSSIPDGAIPPKATAGAAAVRVKLVISRQDLKRMLDKEGVSLDDMVSAMRRGAVDVDRESEHECCGGWRPSLESIPEGSGF